MACECGEGMPSPELLCPGSSQLSSTPAPAQPCAVSLLLHPPCVRAQEAARGWPGSILIASGLRAGGLQQPLLQLSCCMFGATSTLGTLLKVQLLSSPTFVFLNDPSWFFLNKELIWIQLCCWHYTSTLLCSLNWVIKSEAFPFLEIVSKFTFLQYV